MKESRKLLDYWLPPEGAGHPVGCVATSFSFDREFFEGDCLSRFLGLDSRPGEGDDLAFLVEEEERLAEARVTMLVDRSWSAEGHNLRWDVIPVGLRGGLQHSKVALLVWDRLIRVVIGSANATRAGYREQVETAVALDAMDGSELPSRLFLEVTAALRRLVNLAPGRADRTGPKRRVLATLDDAERRIKSFALPPDLPRGLWATVVASEPGHPALSQLERVWKHGPAREASVLSPYFDSVAGPNQPTRALGALMAQRGDRKVTFVIPADLSGPRSILRAPRSIRDSVPKGVNAEFRPYQQPEEDGSRRLHAKAILLESDAWATLMIGSSNFTTAGLGLGEKGHFEINIAFGASQDSREGKDLRRMLSKCQGDAIDPDEATWEPDSGEEDLAPIAVPWGFREALLDPGPPATLHLELESSSLPPDWKIETPEAATLFTSAEYADRGRPAEVDISFRESAAPFLMLSVVWTDGGAAKRASWPLNVTDLARLLPASELRNLPLEVLLDALASTRPLHEALSESKRRHAARQQSDRYSDLDPLKRYSQSGRLLFRARRVSMALDGLKRRLERPAASLDALEWRLNGVVGPKAVAEALVREANEGQIIKGETSFVLAEIALMLSRVRWHVAPTLEAQRSEMVAKLLGALRDMRGSPSSDARLASYVERAFSEAAR